MSRRGRHDRGRGTGEPYDPTMCDTWALIAPGEPCPTCADQHDVRIAQRRAEAEFRDGPPTFDLAG